MTPRLWESAYPAESPWRFTASRSVSVSSVSLAERAGGVWVVEQGKTGNPNVPSGLQPKLAKRDSVIRRICRDQPLLRLCDEGLELRLRKLGDGLLLKERHRDLLCLLLPVRLRVGR
jgi:hypothetical protein